MRTLNKYEVIDELRAFEELARELDGMDPVYRWGVHERLWRDLRHFRSIPEDAQVSIDRRRFPYFWRSNRENRRDYARVDERTARNRLDELAVREALKTVKNSEAKLEDLSSTEKSDVADPAAQSPEGLASLVSNVDTIRYLRVIAENTSKQLELTARNHVKEMELTNKVMGLQELAAQEARAVTRLTWFIALLTLLLVVMAELDAHDLTLFGPAIKHLSKVSIIHWVAIVALDIASLSFFFYRSNKSRRIAG